MKKDLFKLVEMSKNKDDEALLELILRFKPTIQKFKRQLHYEEAETDLIISLIEIINKIDLKKAKKNEAILIKYIHSCLNNKKRDLLKQRIHHFNEKVEFVELNLEKIENPQYNNNEDNLFLCDLLKDLPFCQKRVIVDKFIKGYRDTQIAKTLNISRQAVNRLKNRGLENIRKEIARMS